MEPLGSFAPPPATLKRTLKRILGGIASAAIVASSLVFGGAGVAYANTSTVAPLPNPSMVDKCEIDLAITLDYSNSMTSGQLAEQELAVKNMATALLGYPVNIALFNFGSASPISSGSANAPLPLTSVSTQAGVDAIHAKLDSFSRSGVNYTNWQAAFNTVRTSGASYDALVLVTDGNPTRITEPAVVQNTNDNPVNQAIVDGGVIAANELKLLGTRIIGVAVTDNLNTTAYNAMLRQIPQVTGPTEGSDYLLGGLSGLQQTLLNIVNENCAIIDLEKDGALSADGNTIDYDFTVRNNGAVRLTDVSLEDPMPGLSSVTWGTWPGDPFVLDPGEEVTATATYTVTPEDRDGGSVYNLATAYGTPPSGGTPVQDEDPAEVPIPPADPSITLVKTADPQTYSAVGEEITYTFVVENDGDVALSAVDVSDELAGLSNITFSNWPGAPNVLLPGENVTGTATLTVTQTHLDEGLIYNVATATGTPPSSPGNDSPDPVTDTDDATVTGPALNPDLTLVKTADVDTYAAGDTITYTFTIVNTGNTSLSDVVVTDPLAGLSALTYTWPGGNATGVLEPGQTAVATATYTATQADVDRGFIHNAATATGNPPLGPDPENPPQPPTTPPSEVTIEGEASQPAIDLVKSGALSADENSVTYTFVATNIGNVTLTDVEIHDPMVGLSTISYDWTHATAPGTLASNESVIGVATYSVTSADRDAGSIVNLAHAEGTPPNVFDPEDPEGPGIPQEPVTDEDPAQVALTQTAAISLVKDGALDITETSRVGDLVTYTFTITNTGNVTLSDVQVNDEMLADAGVAITIEDSAWPGAVGVLEATESVQGSASYPLTQADIDAGQVDNLAIATGVSTIEDPENPGEFITPEDEDDVTVQVNVHPALHLEKTGAFDGEAVAGDTITYGFTVTNTGNQTLTDVTITDEMLADAGVEIEFASDAWPSAAGVLAPGQSVEAIAIYTLTQADIDSGHVYNSASATGTPPTPPGGDTPPQLPPVEDDVDLPTPGDPSITLVKTSELAGEAQAGDVVEFTFVATNTGELTLDDVTIADPLPGLSALVFDWSEAIAEGVLAPGESVTATATYTLTQADVDAGHLDNTATTVGTPPNAYDPEDPDGPGVPREPVEDDDTIVTPLDPRASITLVKDGSLDGAAAAGETVTYTFVATNTGATTLSDVAISDPLPGLSALVFDWSEATAEGALAPGESVTATATYTLTLADIDAGGVVNLATTVGTPPNAYDPEAPEGPGTPREPVTDEDPAFVPTPQSPAIQLVKTGVLAQESPRQAGDLIEYTFVATNIGNVTLSDVTITDPLAGLSAVALDWSEATSAGVLAPGESVTGVATYPLTQADIDAGHVDNVATATGLPPADPSNPDDPRDPVEDEDDVTVQVTPAPSINLVKTSELERDAKAGDVVLYAFTGTNTGNVTLTDVVIEDPLPGLGDITYTWPGETGVLAPGEQVIATAPYTLTQADVDNGEVHNTAGIIGTPPATYDPEHPDTPLPHDPVTDDDTVVTPLPPAPAIELVKTGESTGNALAGDQVKYTFVATNTGNVTLSGVVIDDPLDGLSTLSYEWPGEAGVLAPGESVTATASYTLTETDVTAGKVDNTATATGTAPHKGDPATGESVSDTDSATVTTGKLAMTGGEGALLPLTASLGLLLLGAGLVLVARNRKQAA